MKRSESEVNEYTCLICKEAQSFYSVGSCDHKNICLICCMRLRILYNDSKCSVCNTKLDLIYITQIQENNTFYSYKELEAYKDECFKDEEFEKNGIYYESFMAKEEALKLRNYICPIKSCKASVFENLQNLCNHLSYTHKKNFCQICLNDGKKFLSENKIYSNEKLKEHQEYGEYSNEGVLITPIHPPCPYCETRFYNEEFLFKHLNETHISCHICKNKKNLVFYNNVQDLTEHFQYTHQVCPYEECLKDTFVVFEKEEELNAHLIKKHKCKDSFNKMSDFIFNRNKEADKRRNPYKNENHKEFNFTDYCKELKERMDSFAKNQKELYDYQVNGHNNHQAVNKYGQYDSHQQGYYHSNQYNGYSNSNGYNNYNNQEETYDQWQGGGGGKKKKKGKNTQNNQSNQYYDSYDDTYNNSTHNYIASNVSLQKNTYSSDLSQFVQNNQTTSQIILDNFLTSTKEYINTLIRKDNPSILEFIAPRERQYQLIIIIDKTDIKNLTEFQFITNFGIPLEEYKCLKTLSKAGYFEKNKLFDCFRDLSIKQILMFYKYLYVALAKSKGLFFKFEPEQIVENLYDDFVFVKNGKKCLKSDNSPFADYDPEKDKDPTLGKRTEKVAKSNENRLNFNEPPKKKPQAPYQKKKFDNLEDFPELVVENKSTIVQKSSADGSAKTPGSKAKNIPGFSANQTQNKQTSNYKQEVKTESTFTKPTNYPSNNETSKQARGAKFNDDDFPELIAETNQTIDQSKLNSKDVRAEKEKPEKKPKNRGNKTPNEVDIAFKYTEESPQKEPETTIYQQKPIPQKEPQRYNKGGKFNTEDFPELVADTNQSINQAKLNNKPEIKPKSNPINKSNDTPKFSEENFPELISESGPGLFQNKLVTQKEKVNETKPNPNKAAYNIPGFGVVETSKNKKKKDNTRKNEELENTKEQVKISPNNANISDLSASFSAFASASSFTANNAVYNDNNTTNTATSNTTNTSNISSLIDSFNKFGAISFKPPIEEEKKDTDSKATTNPAVTVKSKKGKFRDFKDYKEPEAENLHAYLNSGKK